MGFEPTLPVKINQISNLAPSTTRPLLRLRSAKKLIVTLDFMRCCLVEAFLTILSGDVNDFLEVEESLTEVITRRPDKSIISWTLNINDELTSSNRLEEAAILQALSAARSILRDARAAAKRNKPWQIGIRFATRNREFKIASLLLDQTSDSSMNFLLLLFQRSLLAIERKSAAQPATI